MEHWTAAKGVLRYIAGSLQTGIMYGGGNTAMEGYCDSDFASDISSRRSTTGFVYILNGGAVSWNSKLQKTVAASTSEAAIYSASEVEAATVFCSLLFQLTAPPLRMYTKPVVDLLLLMSLAKSESQ